MSTSFVTRAPYQSPTDLSVNTGIDNPQQFSLKSILVTLSDGQSFEMKPVLLELCIYEDLFSPAMSGYFMITDAYGFLEKYKIDGFSFVEFQFNKSTISDKQSFDKTFRIYKVGERQQHSRSNESYPIYFCSEELMLSAQTKVLKSYPNKRVDQIVTSILTNMKCKKLGTIEQTSGEYSFIVPNLAPFEAINWLANYAQPSDRNFVGADMLFYENRNGYNFRSIQSMITDNSNFYNSYNYSPQNIEKTNINYDQSSILSYKIIESFDTLKMTSLGGFANKVITFDPLLRTANTTEFSYNKYFNKTNGILNKFGLDSGYTNRLGKTQSQSTDAVINWTPGNSQQRNFDKIKESADTLNSTAPDIGAEVFVPNRVAQLALINSSKVQFLVPGDPGLSVGRTVYLNLPSYGYENSPEQNKLDTLHSGKYLVSAVQHKLDMRGVYHCLVEAVKDSLSAAPTGYNNSNAIKSVVSE